MSRPKVITGRRDAEGFTMIELLVVVVILGILSSVVVFAVRGADNKGLGAAQATERRILRTAMEAYCAQVGTYPVGDVVGQLEAKGFLSNRPGYYNLETGPRGDAFPEGSCAGLGYNFIGGPEAAQEKCLQMVGDQEELIDVSTQMLQQGFWCLAEDLPAPITRTSGGDGLVQLSPGNGKVLAVLAMRTDLEPEPGTGTTIGQPTALFDPSAGPRGSWSPGPVAYAPPPPADYIELTTMLLLTGDQCGDSCGKVMANFNAGTSEPASESLSHWKLYDPAGDDGVEATIGAWSTIQPQSPFPRGKGTALQLKGPGCASDCGKVLIVGQNRSIDNPGPRMVEVYDPGRNLFLPIGLYEASGQAIHQTHLTELPDGRVLFVVSGWWRPHPASQAYIIDLTDSTIKPVTGDGPFEGTDKTNYMSTKYLSDFRSATLPEPKRGVLFLQSHAFGDTYIHVDRPGIGSWEEVQPAGCLPGSSCNILTKLADGRILVAGSFPDSFLFDPKAQPGAKWSETGQTHLRTSGAYVTLLSAAPCGMNCNKVLAVGGVGEGENTRAQLYTAPR